MLLTLQEMELNFLHLLRDASNEFLDAIFEAITFLGEQYALIVLLVIIFYAFDRKKGERIMYAIFSCSLLNGIVKLFVQRPRPFSSDVANPVTPARQETATGYSFPSGHTQNSSVAYSSVALNFRKKWILIVVPIVIALIGFSRLLLGVHYPTDVIVGLILGVGSAFLCYFLMNKFEHDFKKKMLLYLGTALVFLPFVVYFYISYKIKLSSTDDIELLYRSYKDMFVSYGLFLGFILAVYLEHKYVNFKDTTLVSHKILRVVFGLIFVIATYALLSVVFKAINKFCVELDIIRYFMVSVVGIGLYPIIMKKWLFKD